MWFCHVASHSAARLQTWCVCGVTSTVSRHRQARRSPRAPPAGGGTNEHMYCHYILTGVVIKSVTDTLKYDCRPHWIPQHHWARVLSFWRCLYAIGSGRCQCCLWLLHAKFTFGFGALNNAIRSVGFCQCFGKVRLFFAVQVQRPI